MEHLDIIFMMIGVVYTSYVIVEGMLRLDYQVRRRKRRRGCREI